MWKETLTQLVIVRPDDIVNIWGFCISVHPSTLDLIYFICSFKSILPWQTFLLLVFLSWVKSVQTFCPISKNSSFINNAILSRWHCWSLKALCFSPEQKVGISRNFFQIAWKSINETLYIYQSWPNIATNGELLQIPFRPQFL